MKWMNDPQHPSNLVKEAHLPTPPEQRNHHPVGDNRSHSGYSPHPPLVRHNRAASRVTTRVTGSAKSRERNTGDGQLDLTSTIHKSVMTELKRAGLFEKGFITRTR